MNVDDRLLDFSKKHELTLVIDGECGFGRPCVGYTSPMGNYVDYNPTRYPDYDEIPELCSDDHFDLAPSDAYHKHDCMAVLVHDDNKDEALEQLLEWVGALEDRGVTVVEYETGAVGVQAMVSGSKGYALKLSPR